MSARIRPGDATAYVTPQTVALVGRPGPDAGLLAVLTGACGWADAATALGRHDHVAVAHASGGTVHVSVAGVGRVVVRDLDGHDHVIEHRETVEALTGVRSVTLDLGARSSTTAAIEPSSGTATFVTGGMVPASVVHRELAPSTADDPFAVLFGVTAPHEVEPAAVREGGSARPVVLLGSTGQRVVLDRPALLGRNPYVVDDGERDARIVRVDDPAVSRRHALVRMGRWTATVDDLRSANGTSVELPGGATATIRPGSPGPLVTGAVIRIGRTVSFSVEDVA